MADNTTLNSGSGGDTIAADDISSVKYQRVKVTLGADGVNDGDVSSANPIPVTGTITAVTSLTNALPAGTNAIGKLAANSGVDIGDVDVTSLPSTVHSADFDTGAGTDTTLAFGIAVPASGGAAVVPGDATAGLKVDLGADNDVTVTGTVTANLAAGTNNIGDVDVLTVPAPLSTTGGGTEATALRVTLASDSTGLVSVDDNGGSLTVDGTVAVSGTVAVTQSGTWDEVGINDSGNSITVDAPVGTPVFVQLSDGAAPITTLPVSLASVPSHAVTNAGTFAVQVDGSALTALQKIDDPVLVDDAAFTPATSSVMMSGFQADETATDSVDEGDAGAARMTLDRKQIVNPQPHTAGGLSIFRSLDIDETEEDVKTSAGQVYGWYIFNAVASVRYVKFYNATAANVTVGTTTPVLTLPVPTSSTNGVGFVFNSAMGITFDTAISVACTTGLADNDTGAPGANDVVIQVFYK